MNPKKTVVVLTGAGISAESGISTFRDSNGLWERYRIEDVCTPEAYERNPTLVTDFYNQRRRQLRDVEPNEAHRQLLRLEEAFLTHIITQNVDDLHERAGSTHILHLHGELTKARSDKNHYTTPDDEAHLLSIGYRDIEPDERAADGGRLRPHVVWFGEAVPNMLPAAQICQTADYFLVVGTGLSVYPAANLVSYVPRSAPCIVVDPAAVPVGRQAVLFQEKAGTGVKKAVDYILSQEGLLP